MTELLYGLALLACPLGMGAMMWMMMRGDRNHTHPSGPGASELEQLRAEIEQLRAAQGDHGRSASGQDQPVAPQST